MNAWLNKEDNIFLNCATVLWHFAQCPDYAEVICYLMNKFHFFNFAFFKVLS